MSATETSKMTQVLTFKLGEEVFAVNVSRVQTVLDLLPITKVPRTPDFMKGVINMRGVVVPVVDMNLKFGMETTEETVDTCIIVMEINLENETTVLGALVDAVQEVVELDSEQIEPAPRLGTRLNTEFIEGMGKRDDQFIIILNIDRVFSSDELEMVQATGAKGAKEKEAKEE